MAPHRVEEYIACVVIKGSSIHSCGFNYHLHITESLCIAQALRTLTLQALYKTELFYIHSFNSKVLTYTTEPMLCLNKSGSHSVFPSCMNDTSIHPVAYSSNLECILVTSLFGTTNKLSVCVCYIFPSIKM